MSCYLTPRSAITCTAATAVTRSLLLFRAESSATVLEPDVVGQQLPDLVPAPVTKEGVEPIVGSARDVPERCSEGSRRTGRAWRRALGHRGIEDLRDRTTRQRDPAYLCRGPLARAPRLSVLQGSRFSTFRRSGEHQALASHGHSSVPVHTAEVSMRCRASLGQSVVDMKVRGKPTIFRRGSDEDVVVNCGSSSAQASRTRVEPPCRRIARTHASRVRPRALRAERGRPGLAASRRLRVFSTRAVAPLNSYRSAARSAAARAPAASPQRLTPSPVPGRRHRHGRPRHRCARRPRRLPQRPAGLRHALRCVPAVAPKLSARRSMPSVRGRRVSSLSEHNSSASSSRSSARTRATQQRCRLCGVGVEARCRAKTVVGQSADAAQPKRDRLLATLQDAGKVLNLE